MCSESASSEAAPVARCLMCNVGCPVAVMEAGPDQYRPDYVPHAGYAGLCGRGSVLVNLLDHPERIHEAHRHTKEGREVLALAAAAEEVAGALREADSAAILVDANYGVDTLAAVAAIASEVGAAWMPHVAPSDAGLVHGLDGTDCEFVGPEDLGGAEALLIIGDAYATHPVAAHWPFEAKTAQPRMPILVMADGCGVTTQFASAVYQPRLGSGEKAKVLDAVRTGKTGALGDGAAVLADWKTKLAEAERASIVVGADLGYADAVALGRAVAALAAETGASVCQLTTYGNAWGALRVGASAGAVCPMELLRDPPKALLVIGVDVEAALGRAAAGALLGSVEKLMYAGPMPNATSRRASLVVPAAFGFESAGRALLGPGREVRFEPLLSPPAGVPTLDELLAKMGSPAEAKADLSVRATGPEEVPCRPVEEAVDGQVLLAPAQDQIDFADGSLTRRASWPPSVRPRPVVYLGSSEAEAAGLVDAEFARVECPAGSLEVEVRVHESQRGGQARISAAFPEVRSAMGWSLEGTPVGDPAWVRIGRL
jgi:hypothetical protein